MMVVGASRQCVLGLEPQRESDTGEIKLISKLGIYSLQGVVQEINCHGEGENVVILPIAVPL